MHDSRSWLAFLAGHSIDFTTTLIRAPLERTRSRLCPGSNTICIASSSSVSEWPVTRLQLSEIVETDNRQLSLEVGG